MVDGGAKKRKGKGGRKRGGRGSEGECNAINMKGMKSPNRRRDHPLSNVTK